MIRIPVAEPSLGEEELNNIIDAVKSGWISSKGNYILELEDKFAGYCNVPYGVATSNGTVALHLALEALGIGPGDEVIVPTLTFIATANAVKYTGATPVFVDSHPQYWCIDPSRIEEAITPRTKAIIPVHLYGHPCDMDAIMEIARKHSLYVIEDAAEAHGAEYNGKKVGSIGDINCFSFFGNKIMTTGEGGICLTKDEKLAEKMRVLRDHGMSLEKKYWHDMIGFNYRMTNLQAAIGVGQLHKLDKFIEKKREISTRYNSHFKNISDISLPPEMAWAKNVYWMYCILLKNESGTQRDDLMRRLNQNGIETRPLFYPIHLMPPYHTDDNHFPIAENLSRIGINLPSGVTLTDENISYIANIVKGDLS